MYTLKVNMEPKVTQLKRNIIFQTIIFSVLLLIFRDVFNHSVLTPSLQHFYPWQNHFPSTSMTLGSIFVTFLGKLTVWSACFESFSSAPWPFPTTFRLWKTFTDCFNCLPVSAVGSLSSDTHGVSWLDLKESQIHRWLFKGETSWHFQVHSFPLCGNFIWNKNHEVFVFICFENWQN